ncbi:NAD-dependent epimerase/dehydratase family protein [Demequina capsici]|uniref:NAD(P)H-binding protein n=1 Tax=Demequina capsici TaxID=3075620 RepID=A0AA96F5Z5_9MICO|nr:NAD-dependent epimerase/dehydratase family protein [Demequina sp. OYTSA14]WNM24309.1 NAD(P)H-binding protein [Demequina sp. OYTSA14]
MATHVVLGTGSIGAPLARELASRGHRVVSINRSGSRAGLPPEAEQRVGDVRDPEFLTAALKDADVAYQLTQPPYHRWREEFPPLQEAILDAAARTGTRLVLADNLYCFGRPDGPISDRSPEVPASTKGSLRKEMAAEALAAHRSGQVQVALTRPSHYLGSDYALTRELLVEPAFEGRRLAVIGRTDRLHAFAYVPDVARAMADIGTSDDAWGRAWVLPALTPMTQAELCTRVWRTAGRTGQPKVLSLRGLPMRVASLFSSRVRESLEMLYEFEAPYLVDAHEFEQRFGWTATPLADAIRETVRGVRPDPVIASTR